MESKAKGAAAHASSPRPPCLCVLLPPQDGFRVVAPVQPLRATMGQDVVLPCHVSPRVDIQRLEIWWIRHPSSETVHHYRNGEDQDGEQSRDYRGRTELVRAGLSNGSLDLWILGLRPSDDGQYLCAVQGVTSYSEAAVDLEVAGDLYPLLTSCFCFSFPGEQAALLGESPRALAQRRVLARVL
uniref:Ig-like domain-containing protein n=1 Tax=Strix occidentalis caurina TaxID=311401 RepID=A0A8D0F7H6_STROC